VLALVRRKLYAPLLQLLKHGATPERLAWSIAVGLVIGVNPLLGSTTLLALAVASLLRLNLVASQLGNHVVYPLELLLFPVFIKLGNLLFHTTALPLSLKAIAESVKRHPWDTTKLLWTWEWHALVVWAVFASIAAPIFYRILCPVLTRMLIHIHARQATEI
jgi:uncharacterized protein (DUF2062 family)